MSEESQGVEVETGNDPVNDRFSPSSERPHTSESVGRPKSTSSSEIVFEARKKKRKTPTIPSDDGDGHDVTFTVTIAMAVPTGM